MRTEQDFRGTVEIDDNALYGIHAVRATQNFPYLNPFPISWYKAIGLVKLAYYKTYKSFREAVIAKYGEASSPVKLVALHKIEALITSATEVSDGKHFDSVIVPGMQGGAGTSIHMNVNEIITNRALQLLGNKPGDYHIIDPFEDANIYQSTNDVIPSSLKVAAMFEFSILETAINNLRYEVESLEKKHRNSLRIGYTQMQAAVPTTFGKLFGSYSEALSRDWWRVSKCSERIKQINLGGSAIGTGLTVPRYMIMNVSKTLQELCNLPIARSENLVDATANLDTIVEVHAMIKALAVNLEKISNDVRLLASDISHEPELSLPALQTGSTIMPGKVNPVACEYAISIAHKVYANDGVITSLCALGCLELNAYIPSIGIALLESIQMLTSACHSLEKNLFANLTVNTSVSEKKLFYHSAITTALIPSIGYHKATELSFYMKKNACSVFDANKQLNVLDETRLVEMLRPESLTKEGFGLDEIFDKVIKPSRFKTNK
jgi:aspartate ammonia-lyase